MRIGIVNDLQMAVETPVSYTHPAFFHEQCDRFLAWSRTELAHRQARDAALEKLAFPYGEFRNGQRELAVSVYLSLIHI